MGGVTQNPNIPLPQGPELLPRTAEKALAEQRRFNRAYDAWLARTQGRIFTETEADVVSREVEDDATLEDMGFWEPTQEPCTGAEWEET